MIVNPVVSTIIHAPPDTFIIFAVVSRNDNRFFILYYLDERVLQVIFFK